MISSRYSSLEVGWIWMKSLLKTSATSWSSVIILSETVSSWTSWETIFFDKFYFRFCFYFINKKWLYRRQEGFVICDVTRINITKEILLFIPNQAYTVITMLIICLCINVTFCVWQFISETQPFNDFFIDLFIHERR